MMQITKRLSPARLLFFIFLCHNSFQMILAGKNNKKITSIGQRIKRNPRQRRATDRYNPDNRSLSNQEIFYTQSIASGVKERRERQRTQLFKGATDKEANKLRAIKLVLQKKHYNKKRAARKKKMIV